MNTKEMRTKSAQELAKLARDLKERSRELRFQKASGKVKNVREIRKTAKELAQVLTVLKETT